MPHWVKGAIFSHIWFIIGLTQCDKNIRNVVFITSIEKHSGKQYFWLYIHYVCLSIYHATRGWVCYRTRSAITTPTCTQNTSLLNLNMLMLSEQTENHATVLGPSWFNVRCSWTPLRSILWICKCLWGPVYQKQISRTGNYIPQCFGDVINCSCFRYLLLAHKPSYVLHWNAPKNENWHNANCVAGSGTTGCRYKSRELSWCQLCRHWWHHRSS